MVKLRRKSAQINEDGNQLSQQKLNLLNNKRQVQETFYRAQDEFNRAQEKFNIAKKKRDEEIKKIDDNLLQIEQQLTNDSNATQINNQSNNTNSVSSNNTTESTINEGANIKHDILSKAVMFALKDCDLSYELSSTEILRLARKINDFINSHKKNIGIIDDLKGMIKKYFLNHKSISLSQSEINSFNGCLEKVLRKKEFDIFKNLFNKKLDKFVLYINDYTNVDELEAEIADLDIDIDEDLINNELVLTNIDESLLKNIAQIAKRYKILKINDKLFSYI